MTSSTDVVGSRTASVGFDGPSAARQATRRWPRPVILALSAVLLLAIGAGGTALAFALGETPLAAPGRTVGPGDRTPNPDGGTAGSASTADGGTALTASASAASDSASITPSTTGPPAAPSDDPLALGYPFVNQGCTGEWLVVLASSGESAKYQSTLAPPLSTVGGQYLRTDQSCSSFTRSIQGQPIYAAYLGPYPSMAAACDARLTHGTTDAYVRQLDATVPSRNLCNCLEPAAALPTLDSGNAADPSTADQYLVADIQVMLERAGANPDGLIGGHYLQLTTSMVSQFQAGAGLPITGTTDQQTWAALQSYCQP